MTGESNGHRLNVHTFPQSAVSSPDVDSTTVDNIRQSVSSVTESQAGNHHDNVSLNASDYPAQDAGNEIEQQRLEQPKTASQEARLPLSQSLGISGCLIIVGGTVGSLIGLGFLIFLWTAHGSSFEAADAPLAWRKLMLKGWMGQATTLSALLIRILTAVQATVCTAMLASMFLEKRYVRKADIIQFSLLRAINDGPRKLTELIFSCRKSVLCIEALLALTLTLTNLALQFTSTILFADIKEASIVNVSSPVQVPSYFISQSTEGLFLTVPEIEAPIYRMFGEVETSMSSSPDSKGFSDSGWKQRAILPLPSSEDRTAVRVYQGDATVLSSRVICMRPDIDGQINTVNKNNPTNITDLYVGGFNGTLSYGSSLRDAHSDLSLCPSEGCYDSRYSCNIPARSKIDELAYNTSSYRGGFCTVDVLGADLITRNLKNHNLKRSEISDNHRQNRSLVTLVYSSNLLTTEWVSLSGTILNMSSLPTISQDEWKAFEITPGRFLNVSLCFASHSYDNKYVDMKAKAPLREPSGALTPLSKTWNSSDARTFLGVNPLHQDHVERGILTINNLTQPQGNSSDFPNGDVWTEGTQEQQTYTMIEWLFYVIISGAINGEYSWQGCIFCAFLGQPIAEGYALLFQDTLFKTGRAAEALLGYGTAFGLSWYDEYVTMFEGKIDVDIASIKNVQTACMYGANSCKGLISVATILGVYLLTVFITTALFIRRISYSRQGNAWHAVSQLLGNELGEALENGNDRGDDDMDKWTREEGKDTFVKLERVDGKIQVVRKHPTPQQEPAESITETQVSASSMPIIDPSTYHTRPRTPSRHSSQHNLRS